METSERYWPEWKAGPIPINGPMWTRYPTQRHGSMADVGGKYLRKELRKMSKKEQSQNRPLRESVLRWMDKLGTHFNQPQDEEQINIFLHALRNCTAYQVDHAFERCMNECEFMPKLADVHKRMSDQRYPAENPAAYVLNGP